MESQQQKRRIHKTMAPGYSSPASPTSRSNNTPEAIRGLPQNMPRQMGSVVERDIASPSPSPTFPLIYPPTYISVQTMAPPPPYSLRRGTDPLRWNGETPQFKRDRFGWLLDYRCLSMIAALLMFAIVIVVFVVLHKMGKSSTS